jgi:hypothetical protein
MKPVSIANGRSTDPQTKILEDAFLELKPGEQLSYTDATILLKEPVQCPHCYQASRRAIRKVFEATGVLIKRVRGAGFRRPTADEQVDDGADGMREAAKQWVKSGVVIDRTDDNELSDEGKARKDCFSLANLAIARAFEDQNKKLKAAFKPTPTLPRLQA